MTEVYVMWVNDYDIGEEILRHRHQIYVSLQVRNQSPPNIAGATHGDEKEIMVGEGATTPHIISGIMFHTPMWDALTLPSAITRSGIFSGIPVNANIYHFVDNQNLEIILTWLVSIFPPSRPSAGSMSPISHLY